MAEPIGASRSLPAACGGFRIARGNRRSSDSRSPPPLRRRRRRSHHGHRQAHRAHGNPAGNRHARIPAQRRRREILAQAREIILRTIDQSTHEEKTDWSVIKEKVRVDLKRFLNKQTSKRPLILPVILEI